MILCFGEEENKVSNNNPQVFSQWLLLHLHKLNGDRSV